MTRPAVAFSSAAWLWAFSLLLQAQTQTLINGRGEQRPIPAHASGGGWSATVDHDTARAALTMAKQDLQAGETVDYDLVVTNTGSTAMTVPRALDWAEIDSGAADQNYLKAQVVFELSTKQRLTPLPSTLNLYSVDGKPSTQLVLKPGDSIRILGTVALPAKAFNSNWNGEVALTAHFCVSEIRFASGASPGRGKGFEKKMLWCVTADPNYALNLPEK